MDNGKSYLLIMKYLIEILEPYKFRVSHPVPVKKCHDKCAEGRYENHGHMKQECGEYEKIRNNMILRKPGRAACFLGRKTSSIAHLRHLSVL